MKECTMMKTWGNYCQIFEKIRSKKELAIFVKSSGFAPSPLSKDAK